MWCYKRREGHIACWGTLYKWAGDTSWAGGVCLVVAYKKGIRLGHILGLYLLVIRMINCILLTATSNALYCPRPVFTTFPVAFDI